MDDTAPVTFEMLQRKAIELGYDDVGVTNATIPNEDVAAYEAWIANGYQGNLSYMENRARCEPQQLLPNAKTAILLVSYYKREKAPFRENAGVVASYARGRDYHNIHRKRLKKLSQWIEGLAKMEGITKGFSDSAPILERALAAEAGLGWFGKNNLLIHRRFGTFFLLSGLLTTLEIQGPPQETLLDKRLPRCGSCTLCLDSCPTQALVKPYTLDAAKCLSFHLIESKDDIPEDIQKKNPGYIFGCDICQDVCPHNARKAPATHPEFSGNGRFGAYLTLEAIDQLEAEPEQLHGTPLQRRKVEGLRRNASTLQLR